MAKPQPNIGPEAPQRVFKTAAPPPRPAIMPGQHVANGHNITLDWRDANELKVSIATDAEALAAVFVPTKQDGSQGTPALAKTDGTMYGATIIETPDNRRWYLTVKADLVVDKKGGKA